MAINVKNGTPMHGPSLCDTCVHAHIERGYRESEAVIFCQETWPEHRVQFRVRECSGYVETKRQSLKQMEEMAWLLSPRGAKRLAGFTPSEEPRKDDGGIELVLNREKT
jgi:hypothetical protein